MEGSRRVSTGGATYILKPQILVPSHVTPAFQPRIAEPSQLEVLAKIRGESSVTIVNFPTAAILSRSVCQ
jgi:hypothetical protein